MENPLEVLDRTLGSFAGGINTDEYYAKIYANEQNGVPTETLVVEGQQAPAGNGQQPTQQQAQQQGQQTGYQYQTQQQGAQYVQGQNQNASESPIDAFLRTTVPVGGAPQEGLSGNGQGVSSASQQQTPQVQQQTQQQTYQQTQPVPQYTQTTGVTPKVDVSPTGVFGFVVQAAFSIAVVVSVIGLMFIVYVIIRTRQLHHHEHHVKELGGHGGGHGGGHDAPKAAVHEAVAGHAIPDPAHEREVAEEDEEVHSSTDVHENVEPVEAEPHEQKTEEHDDYGEGSARVDSIRPADVSYIPEKPTEIFSADEETLFASRLKTIKADAAGDDEDAWYTALMDVNLLLEDILSEKGYEGVSVKEMLASEEAKGLATKDVALEAEAQFQKLISGEETLTKDAIVHLVNMYAKVCKELGVA